MKTNYTSSHYAVVGSGLLVFAVIAVGIGLRLFQSGNRNGIEPELPETVVQVEATREPYVEPEPEVVQVEPGLMEGDGGAWGQIMVAHERVVARSSGRPARPASELPQLGAHTIPIDERRSRVPLPGRRQNPTNGSPGWSPAPPPGSIRIALP